MSDNRAIYRRNMHRRRNLEAFAGVLAWSMTTGSMLFGLSLFSSRANWLPEWLLVVTVLLSIPFGGLTGMGSVWLVRLFHRSHWPESPDAGTHD